MKGAQLGRWRLAALVGSVSLILTSGLATPGDECWDNRVGSPGVDGYSVGAVAIHGGHVFAGGTFLSAGGVAATNIACWDGQRWSPLGPGLRLTGNEIGAVYALAVRGEELYAGGDFTHAGDLWVNGIARWDGTNWSPLGDGVFGIISMAFAGSNLYVGGSFRRAGTVVTTNIAMWNGQTWEAVGGGVTHEEGMADGNVAALAVSGDTLSAAGGFLRIGGVNARAVAAWDGQVWLPLGSGIYLGGVLDLASAGDRLYMGGRFSTVGGKPSTNIALWHIPPTLAIRQEGPAAVVSWPSTGTNFMLEAKGEVEATNWSAVSPPASVVGDDCVVTNSLDGPQKLYRLRR